LTVSLLLLLLLLRNRLQVSMLDDKVWQVLAELPAPEALAIIDDAGQALLNPHMQIRNINAYFMVSLLLVTRYMLCYLTKLHELIRC
jgi:hypothetical protein